jgi:hypothetical protein
MTRRSLFALLIAPFLARFLPKPKPKIIPRGFFNPPTNLAQQYRSGHMNMDLEFLWGLEWPTDVPAGRPAMAINRIAPLFDRSCILRPGMRDAEIVNKIMQTVHS